MASPTWAAVVVRTGTTASLVVVSNPVRTGWSVRTSTSPSLRVVVIREYTGRVSASGMVAIIV